jgi:2-methylcitrate dehydratase PrpD
MSHASSTIEAPYTDGLASFVTTLRFEDIPSEVVHRLKLLMLDSFGCALYGAQLEWSRIVRATMADVDAGGSAGVWGTKVRLSAPHAALANGTQVQGFELDDVHPQGVLHVGAVTLPALVAVAELLPAMTGKDFVRAATIGYEVGPRVGMCMGPQHIGQGWHSGATVGVFAAAAAASAALGLDHTQTVDALGIAGTQSSGLMAAQYGAMVKRVHAGHASQSGLYGALLARNGLTGIRDVFESPYGGFCTTFSNSRDGFELDELTAGLGERYEIMNTSLKFYSCVASNHTTLDAIRSIRSARPFEAADVAEIVVHGSQVTVDHVGWPYRPEGMTAAQLNLPFCVATLLLEGDVFVDQFTTDVIEDDARMELSRRVRVVEDPAVTAKGRAARHEVRVEVHLVDGTVLTEQRHAARGSAAHFGSDADVTAKFDKLTADVLDDGPRDRLRDAILRLDELDDVSEVVALLVTDRD